MLTGPNGADRVLGDNGRRLTETLSLTIYDLLLIIVFFYVYQR